MRWICFSREYGWCDERARRMIAVLFLRQPTVLPARAAFCGIDRPRRALTEKRRSEAPDQRHQRSREFPGRNLEQTALPMLKNTSGWKAKLRAWWKRQPLHSQYLNSEIHLARGPGFSRGGGLASIQTRTVRILFVGNFRRVGRRRSGCGGRRGSCGRSFCFSRS